MTQMTKNESLVGGAVRNVALNKPVRFRKVRVPYSILVPLFGSGLSTRQIGIIVGLSGSRVHKMLHAIGIGRPQSEAAIIRQPAKSKHWRSSRIAARKLWERTYGLIPKGFHIHHIDGDHTNNNVDNLDCISSADHMRLHHTGPEYHIPRHLRPARKAYMKEYLKNYIRRADVSS